MDATRIEHLAIVQGQLHPIIYLNFGSTTIHTKFCRDVVVKDADLCHLGRELNTGVVTSIPPCDIINAIGEESNGKPHHKIHFPRKNLGPCLWFLLRSKSSMRRSFFYTILQ